MRALRGALLVSLVAVGAHGCQPPGQVEAPLRINHRGLAARLAVGSATTASAPQGSTAPAPLTDQPNDPPASQSASGDEEAAAAGAPSG